MTWSTSRSLLVLAAALGIAAPIAVEAPAEAQSTPPIRFTLDWKYQGIHAFVFWAQDKGYFAKEGLSVRGRQRRSPVSFPELTTPASAT